MTKLDITNPFMVQEYIRRGIAKGREDLRTVAFDDEQRESALKSVSGMERSLAALNGICVLHLQQVYDRELGRIAWWKFRVRREFERNAFDWEMAKRKELVAEAAAVESFEF
jgi:hypothetical protein